MSKRKWSCFGGSLIVVVVFVLFLCPFSRAADGTVDDYQKITEGVGGFTGTLTNGDNFGSAVASLGDLDGDGIGDLAVGAQYYKDGDFRKGAIWIMFMNADGTVKSYQEISDAEGDFTGTLNGYAVFGSEIACLGDLDGDGGTACAIAVGTFSDDDGASNAGAVWILFLGTDGKVDAYQKISNTQGDFGGTLGINNYFGTSVASLGDLDGDGVTDLAVGADHDNDGGEYGAFRGAVWILFMNSDGTVKEEQKISDTAGDFTGTLEDRDFFGSSVVCLGDLDGNGGSAVTLAVGAPEGSSAYDDEGAVWILFLGTDGKVDGYQKISDTEGDFTGELDGVDVFGCSVTSLGDLDGDGITDLAVGAYGDDDGDGGAGAVWILFLGTDGKVDGYQKISDTEGDFTGTLDTADCFGWSVASLGDLNGDNITELAVGAVGSKDGDDSIGAVWILFMERSDSDDIDPNAFDGWGDVSDSMSFYVVDANDNGYWVTKKVIEATTNLIDGHCTTAKGSQLPHYHFESDFTPTQTADANRYWDWYYDTIGGSAIRLTDASNTVDGLAYAFDEYGTYGDCTASYRYWPIPCEATNHLIEDLLFWQGPPQNCRAGDRIVYKDGEDIYQHAGIIRGIAGQNEPNQLEWKFQYGGVYRWDNSLATDRFAIPGCSDLTLPDGSSPSGTWDPNDWDSGSAEIYYD